MSHRVTCSTCVQAVMRLSVVAFLSFAASVTVDTTNAPPLRQFRRAPTFCHIRGLYSTPCGDFKN